MAELFGSRAAAAERRREGAGRPEGRGLAGRRRLRLLLLGLLLVWTVGLRAWYATPAPTPLRFWDEKYSLPNVYAALEQGSLRPVDFAYLRLTYLPQVAVLGAIQSVARLGDPGFSWFEGGRISRRALLLCRFVQCLIAGLSVLLTYRLGRRVFSAEVGLLGGFLVAASPFHLSLTTIFKPDALLTAATVLAFLWSLRALERPTAGRYLLAGLGVGIAMSAKPTGGAVALPLAVAALWLARRELKHLTGLVLAGVTALAFFLALNPYTEYLDAFRHTRAFYRAQALGRGSADSLAALAGDLLYGAFVDNHGLWIGAAAAGGILLIGLRPGAAAGETERRALERRLLVAFPVIYLLFYGLQARVVLGQNVLPVLPFTALAAAALLFALWRWAGRRIDLLGDRRVVATTVAAFALVVALPVHVVAYQVGVPRTGERAFDLLDATRSGSREVWTRWEEGSLPQLPRHEPGPPRPVPPGVLLWPAAALSEVGEEAASVADAEVFPLARTRGEAGGYYRRRLEQADPAAATILRPRPFVSWGPSLVVLRHLWWPAESSWAERSRRPGYRLVDPEETVELDLYGAVREVLGGSDHCRELALPAGAELTFGYGLNDRFLRRLGRRRAAARFEVRVGPPGAEETVFVRAVRLRGRRAGSPASRPFREATVSLARFGGPAAPLIRVCLRIAGVGASQPGIEGAFWADVAIVDGDGSLARDCFDLALAGSSGRREAASLELWLPAPETVEPTVTVGSRRLEVAPAPRAADVRWLTDRFALAPAGETEVQVCLPAAQALASLPVRVQRWLPGASPAP